MTSGLPQCLDGAARSDFKSMKVARNGMPDRRARTAPSATVATRRAKARTLRAERAQPDGAPGSNAGTSDRFTVRRPGRFAHRSPAGFPSVTFPAAASLRRQGKSPNQRCPGQSDQFGIRSLGSFAHRGIPGSCPVGFPAVTNLPKSGKSINQSFPRAEIRAAIAAEPRSAAAATGRSADPCDTAASARPSLRSNTCGPDRRA
jgi:hypothetical protein